MKQLLIAACAALLLAACAAAPQPAPQVEYKTVTINTACTSFKLILVPVDEAKNLSDRLASEILAHDRAWTALCRTSK